jgi:Xaa-Pro aminopeptidase
MSRTLAAEAANPAKQRRDEFLRRISGGVAIFPSAPTTLRNGDVEHEYRQDTDFYYLTGFEEAGAVAVLAPEHPEHKFVLFVQPKDKQIEVWTGPRAGEEGAIRDYGADAAYTIGKLDEELPKLTQQANRLYYRFASDPTFDERLIGLMRRFQHERQRSGVGPNAVIDPAEILHEMRLIKTEDDLSLLRRAVDITCAGHLAAIRAIKPGAYEYEVEAALSYAFRSSGSPRHGYAPIVAAGANATVLHYTSNRRRIAESNLVLVDAGAEYGYFTGDVSRTLPASGRFTREQDQIYRLVLEAQLEAIQQVRPGATFIEPHDRAVRVLTEGLVKLRLMKGDVDELIKEEKYREFYMHRTSHWLGMDVHDAGPYKVGDEWRKLEVGMVMTVEPGLYIAEDAEGVDPRYRGIGVRIEDDVLVTAGGNEVLSSAVPKDVEEIEQAMKANL